MASRYRCMRDFNFSHSLEQNTIYMLSLEYTNIVIVSPFSTKYILYNFYNTQRMLAFFFFRIQGLHCTCFLVTLDIAARDSIDHDVCCSFARPSDSCYTSHLRGHPGKKSSMTLSSHHHHYDHINISSNSSYASPVIS